MLSGGVKMKKVSKIFSVVVLIIIVLIANPSLAQMKMKTIKNTSGTKADMLRTDMRKLWDPENLYP